MGRSGADRTAGPQSLDKARQTSAEGRMEPDNIDALFDEANRLLEAGEPDAALKSLESMSGRLIEADDRIEWASLRAWALTELGRDAEALEMLDELLNEYPHSARLLGTLGVVLSNNDELEEARDTLEDALSISPDDEVALANLALVYEKLRDFAHAATLYDKALNLGADIDWVLQRKAAVLTESGKYAEAKTTLKRYLSLVPDDATQWIALGILHSDDEEYEQAFACYEQAERIDPEVAALRLNWGVTAVRAQKLQLAYTQLAKLKRVEPRSVRWWLLRAFIFEEEGDLDQARSIYDRILTRARFVDRSEMAYAFEMAMDYYARHKLRRRCERLLERAYGANACTVELCEAYREASGEFARKASWYSLMVEADYRTGLSEVHDRSEPPDQRYTRFLRNFQVVARNHDEAMTLVSTLAREMGERNVAIREFIGTEPVEEVFTGLYEVESEAYVFVDDPEQ